MLEFFCGVSRVSSSLSAALGGAAGRAWREEPDSAEPQTRHRPATVDHNPLSIARLTHTPAAPTSLHHITSAGLPPFFLAFFSLGGSPPVWKRDAGFFFFSDLMGLVLESESSSSSLLVVAGGDMEDTVMLHWVLSAQGDAAGQQDWLPPPFPALSVPFFLFFLSFFSPFT